MPTLWERLPRAWRAWLGEHAERLALLVRVAPRPRLADLLRWRSESALPRVAGALALLVVAGFVICIAWGYLLAWQTDGRIEAEHRQALSGSVEALQAVSPDLARVESKVIRVIERASGLKELRFETEPPGGNREVQSIIDRKGRIVGWFTWEAERPATEIMHRLLPIMTMIAVGLLGFAALAVWQLDRLGRSLERSERRVQKLEYLDPLTDLPNHDQFFAALDRALAARYGRDPLAYAALDLDGFDEINDALGYSGGDEVMAEIGRRLAEALSPASTVVARLGSDEFALLVTGKNAESALFIVETVRQALARPLSPSQPVQVSVSIGLAFAPRDGTSRDELTRRADLALRAAKRRGRGAIVVFAAEMETEFQERRFLKRELADALAAHAFDLHYQPIVKADGAAIIGVEALLRWTHPARGPIPPSLFVPVAEEAGLIDRLGELVLRRAVADAARWEDLCLSVNVSPMQVRNPAFVDVVAAVLRESGFEPARLVLEMTESVLIEEPEAVGARLRELRALGVRLALDDFGSGYSSLRYLQSLPFDKLKIDRSFVAALEQSANGGVIIQAMVALGRALGMTVVIEGIETEEQRVLLRLAGCHEMQGYLFARPAAATHIDRLLQETRTMLVAARVPLRAVI